VAVETIENELQYRGCFVLLTARIPQEGGLLTWKSGQRREVLERLLPHAEAVDIELAKAEAMGTVIKKVRERGMILVLSAHAIQRPASAARLQAWLEGFRQWRPDIAKIAGRVEEGGDLQRLAAALISGIQPGSRLEPRLNMAVMGMGPLANVSRRLLAQLGSCLMYGYLDEPAAPGQPSVAELRKLLQK
jgi:3-dehydroquinate dehydratase-1